MGEALIINRKRVLGVLGLLGFLHLDMNIRMVHHARWLRGLERRCRGLVIVGMTSGHDAFMRFE